MQLIRSILFTICMILLVPPFTFAGILGLFISRERSYKLMSGYSVCIIWLLRVLCNLKLEIIGEENIPSEAVIYMAKHQSAWETITMQTILPANCSWIIKRSLIYIPVFGIAVLAADPIAINRKDHKGALESIITQGKEKIAAGRNIIVFPEGTRTSYGEETRYKLGSAKLAIATGAPVVPIALNAGKFWKRNSIMKSPGTIRLEIGQAIPSKDRDPVELTEEVKSWIESKIKQWEQLPD